MNTIVIYKNTLIAQNDSLNLPFEKIINSDYTYSVNGEIVKKGEFVNSRPVGSWQYNIMSENSKIDTSLYWQESQKDNYSLCYPSIWKKIENNDSTRLFIFDLAPNLERKLIKNQYFIILRHNENKSVESYNDYYNRFVREKNQVEWFDNLKLTLDGNVIGYFNRYQAKINDVNCFVLNYNFQIEKTVYDVSMKVDKNEDKSISQLLFFETLRSFFINDKPVIQRKGILKIE